MSIKRLVLCLFGLHLSFCAIGFSAEIGCWTGADRQLKEDVNTTSKLGQWTETFANGTWGVGSWVKGNATNAAGKPIWKLDGPVIAKSHPSIFFDTDGDGLPDTIRTHYQGGDFTLYDVPGLWGRGAVFSCEDTLIEDHFDPIKKTYEYGFVTAIAVNKKLGLTIYIDARVIETSTAGSSHSGELTYITLVIVPDNIRAAIENRFPGAHIRGIKKKAGPAPYYEVGFVYQGKRMDAEVSAEGVLGKVRSIVDFKDAPAAVAQAIKEKLQDKMIIQIERHVSFGSVKSGKWVAMETPSVLFDVKYLVDGKTENLSIEDAWHPNSSKSAKKLWLHNGKTPHPFIKDALKKVGDALTQQKK